MCRLLKILSIFTMLAAMIAGPALAAQKYIQADDDIAVRVSLKKQHQSLPPPAQQIQPKHEHIHFTDDAGIDPIITGPAR